MKKLNVAEIFSKPMSKGDDALIADCAKRAYPEMRKQNISKMDLMMDLEVVHKQTPLRLKELLKADEFNFFHDICGIYRHLNRQTGELENCFVPRFAK